MTLVAHSWVTDWLGGGVYGDTLKYNTSSQENMVLTKATIPQPLLVASAYNRLLPWFKVNPCT